MQHTPAHPHCHPVMAPRRGMMNCFVCGRNLGPSCTAATASVLKTWMAKSRLLRRKGIQQLLQVDDRDAGRQVAHRVRKYQIARMDHSATRVHDVGDITKPLTSGRNQYGLAGLADHPGWVVQ